MNKYFKCAIPFFISALFGLHANSVAVQQTMPEKRTAAIPPASAVYLASPAYTFDMFFTAMLLQPTGSYLHYAAEAHPLPGISPHWDIYEVRPDYHFGFDTGIGGVFHKTNTSLTLDWEHFHSQDSNHKNVADENMIGPFYEIGPDALPYKKARGHATFHFDQVNLDFGQYVNLGKRLQTHVFAGLGYARIKQIIHSRFIDASGTIFRTLNVPSLFQGAGPQLGLDFAYKIVSGFQFVGKTVASFFVGNLRNHTIFKSTTPELAGFDTTPPNRQSTRTHQRTQVVPGFEGQLGLAYAFNFSGHYMIKLEAGYEAQIYLNAIQSTDVGSEVVTPPVDPDTVGVFARTFQRNVSNFALAGPYFKLEFGF